MQYQSYSQGAFIEEDLVCELKIDGIDASVVIKMTEV